MTALLRFNNLSLCHRITGSSLMQSLQPLLPSRMVAACLWLQCFASMAAVTPPWHIGATTLADQAPSSIESYAIAPGPHSVVVAVIDSGVLPHPNLTHALLAGMDMVSAATNLRGARSGNYAPDERDARCGAKVVSSTFRTHGTEVSSVIAGDGNEGMVGVNPQAKILPVRIFGACGMLMQDMIDAIQWSAGLPVSGLALNANPAKVINISISGGSFQCTPALQKAIDGAIAKGIFIVAAAGNNFQKSLAEPANCNGVISVGAVGADNKIERYSALDPRTTLYAPGGGPKLDTSALWGVNKIRVASYALSLFGQEQAVVQDKAVGTSFAAPVVAGYVSLWLSHHPEKTPTDWQTELPQFLRQVAPLDKCSACLPGGLLANQKAF